MKKVKLSLFVENPDNPQKVTDENFETLIEKIKRNPDGLKADRIAYITDHSAGKRVVLSGNKRLRALKKIYGDNASVNEEWFQDVTAMSEEERNEFIVVANVNDGKFDKDKLFKLYKIDELQTWMGKEVVGKLMDAVENGSIESGGDSGQGEGADDTDSIELRIKLSSKDYERAMIYLRANGGKIEKRFMEIIRSYEGAKK